jgi:AcrR family transcriptional regulator
VGGEKEAPSALMQQLRALYEEDVVPVREIAALAGVTERTLYKYIAKGAWRRRYCWNGSGEHAGAKTPPPAPAHRDEGKKHRQASARFAPVKGAGGRFIRREDAGKPHPRGIKALDPRAAARALADCERAAAFSAPAKRAAALSKLAKQGMAARAASERAENARIRSFERLMTAMLALSRARRAPHIHPRADAVAEKMQHMILDMVERIMLPPLRVSGERGEEGAGQLRSYDA